MTAHPYSEDTLVQQTTAEYLERELGWDSVYAYNNETFVSNPHPQPLSQGERGAMQQFPLPVGEDRGEGADLASGKICLGRASDREVVLTRYLRQKLVEFNPGLPDDAYDDAIRQIVEYSRSQTELAINRDKYALIKDGVAVSYRNEQGELKKDRVKLFDFKEPTNNHFLAVRELWVQGDLYCRRADIVEFVNGLPLLFIECKNIHKDLEVAYRKNLSDYKDTVPHLFHHNAVILLGNGDKAKIGTVSSRFEYFHEWKRLAEEDPGVVDMETLLKGVCSKANFLDLVENFIVFDQSSGEETKILARNHQFLGVNRAIESVKQRKAREGKLGVFWHTQGSGKSYSMLFFTRKVHRKLGGNFTFLICTDRNDLDTQIYKTYAGCGLVDHDKDPCRASDGDHLAALLAEHKAYVFTLVHQFNIELEEGQHYSPRDDVIVITDEAHRTQYGTLALNMRMALPNASYIGFTGTPLFSEDEITRRVFGDYVSTYDFQRAVEDNATVPLYYDSRGDKLGVETRDLNERIAEKIGELDIDDINVEQRLDRALRRDYHVITAKKRLEQVALDFVHHYSNAWESGKAMLVCIDKITCKRMYDLVQGYWDDRIAELEYELKAVQDEQDAIIRKRQIAWMRETRMAIVISEEQGEVELFRKWDLDIKPHRKLIKEGIGIPEALRSQPQFHNKQRMDLDEAFKDQNHPFRVAFVCAMWLTGFDVPCLSTLYLDKPLKAHTLMQAIARANRVCEGKNNGLVVDYCGILKNLRKALATFAGKADVGHGGEGGDDERDPGRPDEDLLADLEEAIASVRVFLERQSASLDDIITKTGFERNAAIVAAKEAANDNDETRKRFEIMCRQVFKKFRACCNVKKVVAYRDERNAINIIYKSLQQDREQGDIASILRQLQGVVDESIDTEGRKVADPTPPFDISKIDFEKLRREFERSPAQKTVMQNMKQVVETRLQRLMEQNPLRTDFQEHYERVVAAYNREKDRLTIERTFEALMKFIQDLDDEGHRAMREELDEETLAIYDLLKKPDLKSKEIKRIKEIAGKLLHMLKMTKLRIDHWRDKESTRDAVHLMIRDYLYSDETGLPVS